METTCITTSPRRRKLYTLVIPIEPENKRIILGYKKRGFGVGKYNGYGGKVEPGETILQGAIRELEEESTLIAKEIEHIAILFLEATTDPSEPILEIHVYSLTKWEGQAQETEEMRPGYYSYATDIPSTTQLENGEAQPAANTNPASNPTTPPASQIPYDEMWEETRLWMEEFLATLASGPVGSPRPKKFIHYVTFAGGHSPQLNKWDKWEGLDKNYVEYFDRGNGEGDISLWTDVKKDAWLEVKRKQMINSPPIHPTSKDQEIEEAPQKESSEYTGLTAHLSPNPTSASVLEWAKKVQEVQEWKARSDKYMAEREAWALEKESWRKEFEQRLGERMVYDSEREKYMRETDEWNDEEKNWVKVMGFSKEEKDRHMPGYIKWLDYRKKWLMNWEQWSETRRKWIDEWERRTEKRCERVQEYQKWMEECEKWTMQTAEWIKETREWVAISCSGNKEDANNEEKEEEGKEGEEGSKR